MPSLSLVMIVKNEAHCLGDCLASVCGIVDEMIIGDTGSTDGTQEIAIGYGAQVVKVPWKNDFAAARNAVLRCARGDWLLHMDADETLDAEGAECIRRVVSEDGAGCDAFELTLLNYCDDPRAWRWTPAGNYAPHARGRAGYLPVPLLRLFRNRAGYRYAEPVHENITRSVVERGGRIGTLDCAIHHHGYASPQEMKPEKLKLYLDIAREKMETNPASVKALHDFAEQATACGLTAEAEAACRTALELDPEHVPSATTLANHLLNRGDLDEAAALLQRFVQQPDPPAHLLMALGALECRQGQLAEARRHLEGALRLNPRSPMVRLYLARVHDLEGDARRAERELTLAEEVAPGIAECAQRLRAHQLRREGERLFQTGFANEALELFIEALKLDREDPLLHNDCGVALHAIGEAARAKESFKRALQLAPSLSEAQDNLAALG